VQHLLHPVGIEFHQGGQRRVERQAQLQMAGSRLGPVHRRHMLAQLHQIRGLHGEAQLARLVAAEVEYVVEQSEQFIARLSQPSMAFMGVRISWLTAARKRPLASTACWACSWESCRECSCSTLAVTSCTTP